MKRLDNAAFLRNLILLSLLGIVGVFAVFTAPAARSAPTASMPASVSAETSVPLTICDVWGDRLCGQALRVAWCESRFDTRATNGQYRGLFQMGSYERRIASRGRYSSAQDQARAALRYFRMTGSDWGAWTCRWAA